jgi:hypothetical protein
LIHVEPTPAVTSDLRESPKKRLMKTKAVMKIAMTGGDRIVKL